MRTRLTRLVAMVVMVAVLMGVAAPAAFALPQDPFLPGDPFKTFIGDTAKQPGDPYRGSQDFATNVVLFLIRDQ